MEVSDVTFSGAVVNHTEIGSLADRDIVEIPNGTAVDYITDITYKVGTDSVTISKNNFKDYFRVGDSYVKVFKAD